jgi:hypothetical protein
MSESVAVDIVEGIHELSEVEAAHPFAELSSFGDEVKEFTPTDIFHRDGSALLGVSCLFFRVFRSNIEVYHINEILVVQFF